MTTPAPTKLRLAATREEAIRAVLDALPKDAIVRDEDDGLGRFAGERTVVITARSKSRLMMFRGTYGAMKGRLEQPHLDVVFEDGSKGLRARVVPETITKPTLASHAWAFFGNAVTVAALVVAYYFVRKEPVDATMTVAIALGGGAAWSIVARFTPQKVDRSLHTLVLEALAPLRARKAAREPEADQARS